MKAKHHLFLISYQDGIWFFSKHSTNTVFFLYLLSSSKNVSLPLSRNLLIWQLSCGKQAEQLCRATADGAAPTSSWRSEFPGVSQAQERPQKTFRCLTVNYSVWYSTAGWSLTVLSFRKLYCSKPFTKADKLQKQSIILGKSLFSMSLKTSQTAQGMRLSSTDSRISFGERSLLAFLPRRARLLLGPWNSAVGLQKRGT